MKTKKYLLTVILAYPKSRLLFKICLLYWRTNHALICILHENFPNGYYTNLRMSHYVTDCCVYALSSRSIGLLLVIGRQFSRWLTYDLFTRPFRTQCKSNADVVLVVMNVFIVPLTDGTPKIIN